MINEFLMLEDCYDTMCPTSIIHPSQLLNDVMGVKQVGNTTHRLYSPQLGDNCRVYTYNFETKQVELDTILAVDHIIGDFDLFEVSSYRTPPVKVTSHDKLAMGNKGARFSCSFGSCNKMSRKLLLQAIKYNNLPSIEEGMCMWYDNNGEDIDINMDSDTGILIGYILGSGGVNLFRDEEQIVIYPKTANDRDIVLDIIEDKFNNKLEHKLITNGKNREIIIITDTDFIDWFKTTHSTGEDLQLPSQYYSAPEEYINGIIYGMTQSSGKKSINSNKNVMYFTVIAKSQKMIDQFNELLFLYLNISAHTSSFKTNERSLFISNIRVNDYVCDVLGIMITDDEKKFIPPTTVYELEEYSDLESILSVRVKNAGKVHETYRLHLKNNNAIIGLNGLIYKTELGIHM